MRHRKKSKRFARPRAQRKALKKSLIKAFIINERIITTTAKAKYLRPEAEKIITLAKKGTIASRRLAFRVLENHALVKKLFDVIAPMFKDINGGYTRILKVGSRKGDNASLSLIEMTKTVKEEKEKTDISKQKEEKAGGHRKETKTGGEKEQKVKKSVVSGVKKMFERKNRPIIK